MAADHVIVIKSFEEFQAQLKSHLPVIVDFSATWCGPCKMISPKFHQHANTYHGKAVFLNVDVDEVEAAASFAGISAMPTFQVYINGVKKDELVGANPAALEKLVKKYCA